MYREVVKLVSWNVKRRSEQYLLSLEPDVAVLPEWGELPMEAPRGASSFVEVGEDGRRGLGVAAWGDWSVSAAEVEPLPGKGVVGAIDVDGPTPFKLIAVWAYLSETLAVNPVLDAVDRWSDWIGAGPLLVAGDFNTGSAWRDQPAYKDHPPIVERLALLGLRSAYHDHHGVEQGVDEATTFISSADGRYMIDHIFVPRTWTVASFEVGDVDTWRGRSDHMPLIAEVEPPRT